MSTGYDKAPTEAVELVHKTMQDHHPELDAEGVTIQVLFAYKYGKEEEPKPAIKVRGHVALAKISITSLPDRVRGIPDAKLVIDATYGWEHQSDSKRIALLDHELTHLQLMFDAEGAVKYDDRGRPRLRLRHHDWELTGFAEVCERHGEAAVEVREMVRWQENYGQFALFPLKGTSEVKVAK